MAIVPPGKNPTKKVSLFSLCLNWQGCGYLRGGPRKKRALRSSPARSPPWLARNKRPFRAASAPCGCVLNVLRCKGKGATPRPIMELVRWHPVWARFLCQGLGLGPRRQRRRSASGQLVYSVGYSV